MANIRFTREPGRLYDLFYIFILHFNRSLWINNFVNTDKAKSDTDFYNLTLNEFSNISDELFLLFYMKNGSESFLLKYYFFGLYADIFSDYRFENIKNKISDVKKFAENLSEFYFPENKNHIDITENGYMDKALDLVEKSGYTALVKHRILDFFVKPRKYVQKLIYELVAKEALLNKYYKKNHKKVVAAQENFNFKQFLVTTSEMGGLSKKIYEAGSWDIILVSVCIIAKNTVFSVPEENATLLVLGCDYEDSIRALTSQKNEFKLGAFGRILTEKNRLLILDMLLDAGELMTSDIAKKLDVSVNAAFYHLEMMTSVNMLLTRNKGRAVYYRINNDYLRGAIESISSYRKY